MSIYCSADVCLRLQEVRKSLKMNRNQFAEVLSISESHLANVENGHRAVTVELLDMLYVQFGISADYLLYGRGSMFVCKTETNKGFNIYTMTDSQKMNQMLQLYGYFVQYKSIDVDNRETEIYEYLNAASEELRREYMKRINGRFQIREKFAKPNAVRQERTS